MEVLLVPVVALLIPIIIVPTALGFKHARFLREVEHAERMKAMELGRTLAEDESWSPASLAAIIGGAVPLASLLVAFLASKQSIAVAEPVAAASGVIGLAGVLCGTFLAARLFQARRHAAEGLNKPERHPELFDFAGHRG